MSDPFLKKYYKIAEVAEIIGVPTSTLRYWESEFATVRPKRGQNGQRYYHPGDVERLRQIYYLLKVKGLKVDAAKAALNNNPSGISRNAEVAGRLLSIRRKLVGLLEAIESYR